MQVINMREAKSRLSSLVKSQETIIVTLRNKPVAKIEALSQIESSLIQAQESLKNTGIAEAEALELLKIARQKIYAPRA